MNVPQEANYMPEDNTRDNLRVGGWIPPYSPGGDAATEPIRPTVQPLLSGHPRARDHFARVRQSGSMKPRLVLVAALCLACAATAAVGVLIDAARKPDQTAAAEFTFPKTTAPIELTPAADQTDDNVPVFVQPSPSATSLSATSAPASASSAPPSSSARPSSAAATTTKPATKAPKPTTTTPAPPVSLTAGSTGGLLAVDQSGERVRHSDFRGVLDQIGSTSSDGARASSNFRIRSGLAGNGCVSFESVNFPGYYLRHYNFEIRLSRIENKQLFREDASFCPVTIREGAAVALRSVNYPTHYLVADRDRLKIVPTSADRALALKPGPEL
ncbi:MAG TPA: AbfB domain-containing protein [Actinoplanes sp.]|nr:AbfB domain-containing protein [Actinoplanes sp.]